MNQRLVWNFEFARNNISPLDNLIDSDKDELKWEVRYFWPEKETIILIPNDSALLDIAHYEQKHKEDYYYLLPNNNYNIKRRRNELLYKPLLDQSENALGFGAKINLEQTAEFPADSAHLHDILRLTVEKGVVVHVKKESFIYKFPTTPSIKLELARLEVQNKTYFSACIEGRSVKLVKSISQHLLGTHVSCDYVTFLKNIIKT